MAKSNEIVFQFISEPMEVNYGGKVHGGAVMKWIDQAAYTCARNWAEGYCVTVHIGGTNFYQPINIGQVIRVVAKVIYTGSSSMHIAVDVFARDFDQQEFSHKVHSVAVFVCIDESGKPQPVSKWEPQSEHEKRLELYAKTLKTFQQQMDKEISHFLQAME